MKLRAIRHGEVLLQPVEQMPEGKVEKHKTYIVGHSETQHHHVLEATKPFDVQMSNEELYIRLFAPGKLVHQKTVNRHNDLTVAPGIYKVIRKQEYSPFERVMRAVFD